MSNLSRHGDLQLRENDCHPLTFIICHIYNHIPTKMQDLLYILSSNIKNVSSEGVVHHELIEKGMKTKEFHSFLTNIKLPNDKKHYLLLDNLPVHKAKQSCIKLKLAPIKELMASKNIEPLYLPPYTPEMNPTELCFNFIRQQVEKNKPRTYEELKLVIDKIIGKLNEKDLTEYFRHCLEYD